MGDDELISFSNKPKKAYSNEELIAHFDEHIPLFRKERAIPKIEPKEIEVTPRSIPVEKGAPIPESEEIAASEVQKEPTTKEEKVVLGEEVQYKM